MHTVRVREQRAERRPGQCPGTGRGVFAAEGTERVTGTRAEAAERPGRRTARMRGSGAPGGPPRAAVAARANGPGLARYGRAGAPPP